MMSWVNDCGQWRGGEKIEWRNFYLKLAGSIAPEIYDNETLSGGFYCYWLAELTRIRMDKIRGNALIYV